MNLCFSINCRRQTAKMTDKLNQRQRLRPRIYDVSFLWCRSHLKTLQHAVRLLYQQSNRPTVLDIGCGNKPLRALFPKARYLGVDISPDSAADMIVDCNRDRLPMDDNSVDAIIISNALEHIYNTQHITQEARRIIKPNGFLFFSVPMSYPVHAHPHDYLRFTRYYFQRAFSDWEAIELNATNSLFSTPLLLGGLIFDSFLPRWIVFFPILLNNVIALLLDHATKFLFNCIGLNVLKKVWVSCPIELNGIYKNIS